MAEIGNDVALAKAEMGHLELEEDAARQVAWTQQKSLYMRIAGAGGVALAIIILVIALINHSSSNGVSDSPGLSQQQGLDVDAVQISTRPQTARGDSSERARQGQVAQPQRPPPVEHHGCSPEVHNALNSPQGPVDEWGNDINTAKALNGLSESQLFFCATDFFEFVLEKLDNDNDFRERLNKIATVIQAVTSRFDPPHLEDMYDDLVNVLMKLVFAQREPLRNNKDVLQEFMMVLRSFASLLEKTSPMFMTGNLHIFRSMIDELVSTVALIKNDDHFEAIDDILGRLVTIFLDDVLIALRVEVLAEAKPIAQITNLLAQAAKIQDRQHLDVFDRGNDYNFHKGVRMILSLLIQKYSAYDVAKMIGDSGLCSALIEGATAYEGAVGCKCENEYGMAAYGPTSIATVLQTNKIEQCRGAAKAPDQKQ